MIYRDRTVENILRAMLDRPKSEAKTGLTTPEVAVLARLPYNTVYAALPRMHSAKLLTLDDSRFNVSKFGRDFLRWFDDQPNPEDYPEVA